MLNHVFYPRSVRFVAKISDLVLLGPLDGRLVSCQSRSLLSDSSYKIAARFYMTRLRRLKEGNSYTVRLNWYIMCLAPILSSLIFGRGSQVQGSRFRVSVDPEPLNAEPVNAYLCFYV